MTVRLDLRPDRLDERTERAAKRAGVLCAVSLCVFFLCAAAFAAASAKAFLSLKTAKNLSVENKIYEERAASAVSALKELRSSESAAARNVDFVFGGVPALEFLDGVAACGSKVTVECIEMSPGSALVKGTAFSDGDVLAFADALARLEAVEDVGVPAVASDEGRGVSVKSFSINVKLKDIRRVMLSSCAAFVVYWRRGLAA